MSKKLRDVVNPPNPFGEGAAEHRKKFETFLSKNGMTAGSIRLNPKTKQFKAHSVQHNWLSPERETEYTELRRKAIATDRSAGDRPGVAGPQLISVLRSYNSEIGHSTSAHLKKHFGKHPALTIVDHPPSSDGESHRVHLIYDPSKGNLP